MDDSDTVRVSELGTDWVTLAQAADSLGVSVKTARRRAKAGELEAVLAFDPRTGSERYMVKLPETPTGDIVAVAHLEQITGLLRELADLAAVTARAEAVAEFERERRKDLAEQLVEARRQAEEARQLTEEARRQAAEAAHRWWKRKERFPAL